MNILTTIERATRRDDVVAAYAEVIFADASGPCPRWTEINRAIVNKWSYTGLGYIKERAWKIVLAEVPS